jgi:hypothetical protein
MSWTLCSEFGISNRIISHSQQEFEELRPPPYYAPGGLSSQKRFQYRLHPRIPYSLPSSKNSHTIAIT